MLGIIDQNDVDFKIKSRLECRPLPRVTVNFVDFGG
jgi:hypothetical protein